MSTEVALFLLRLVSASLLLIILAAIFTILWKDFRNTGTQIELRSHIFGQVSTIHEHNGEHHATGDSFPLRPLTRLGRAPTNDIIVDDTFASSEHAQIVLRDGQWWLEDRNSRNGTMLNGNIINQPVVITAGDIIRIGDKRFRLDMEQSRWI